MQKDVYQNMYAGQDTFWWHRGMRKFFGVFLEKYVRSTNNIILDIGCGTGALFPVLKKYGTVYGLDISEEAVLYAKKTGIAKEVKQGNASTIPYGADIFDVVVCSDLLYHANVEDDKAVLIEIRRVLKKGGLLVIKEASYDWLRSRMDELVQTKHRYTRSELKGKIETANFEIVRATYMMTFLFPAALISRLIERVIPRRYGASELFISNSIINILFTSILYFETSLIRWLNFPFGLSIMSVARRK